MGHECLKWNAEFGELLRQFAVIEGEKTLLVCQVCLSNRGIRIEQRSLNIERPYMVCAPLRRKVAKALIGQEFLDGGLGQI